MGKRHYAQVARLRVETAIIEFDVDPNDVEGAQTIAEQRANQLRQSSWHLEPFDADEYAPFVMSIVHETEVDEIRQERAPIGTVDPQKQVDVTGEIRFVLLSGNLSTGEGEIICQPWLTMDPPDLLDRIDKLDALGHRPIGPARRVA